MSCESDINGRAAPPGITYRRGIGWCSLLVAIAGILLTIALLLPLFDIRQERTRCMVCMSNLRQVALAWDLYLEDSRGSFLKGLFDVPNYGGKRGLSPFAQGPKPLNRYLKLPTITMTGAECFICPGDTDDSLAGISYADWYGTSYRTNPLLVGPEMLVIDRKDPSMSVFEKVNQRLAHIRRSAFSDPSRLLLLGDAGWVYEWARDSEVRLDWHPKPSTYNLAFMDGHVEFVRIRKGVHVSSRYTVFPFLDLTQESYELQEEMPAHQ